MRDLADRSEEPGDSAENLVKRLAAVESSWPALLCSREQMSALEGLLKEERGDPAELVLAAGM